MKLSDLSDAEQGLVRAALQARNNAQAPYSNYFVGAAVITERLSIYPGCNVERANYASGSHAEQVAIDSLIARLGPTRIVAIAVVGGRKGESPSAPVWPCGHCRQIIWENSGGDPHVKIISYWGEDNVEVATIGELFAKPFGPLDLGIDIFNQS